MLGSIIAHIINDRTTARGYGGLNAYAKGETGNQFDGKGFHLRRPGAFELIYDYDHASVGLAPKDGREWASISGGGPFPDMVGPMFVTYDNLVPGEPARFGLRVQKHHCNAVDVVHGGLLATFADTALAQGLISLGDVAFNTPTINLSVDFLSGAVLNEWLESRVVVSHRTRRMVFMFGTIIADTRPVLRVNGLFKISPRTNDDLVKSQP